MKKYHQILTLSEENIAVDLLWFGGFQAGIIHKRCILKQVSE